MNIETEASLYEFLDLIGMVAMVITKSFGNSPWPCMYTCGVFSFGMACRRLGCFSSLSLSILLCGQEWTKK
jgi:hypothetical protein